MVPVLRSFIQLLISPSQNPANCYHTVLDNDLVYLHQIYVAAAISCACHRHPRSVWKPEALSLKLSASWPSARLALSTTMHAPESASPQLCYARPGP
jgi:hypothetical protein